MRKPIFLKAIIIFCLLVIPYSLGLASDDYLSVKGNIKTNSLTFATFTGDTHINPFPLAPLEGETFYDYSTTGSTAEQPCYFDGTQWKAFGEGPKNVASAIVAASNSQGTYCDGALCSNPRAEDRYVCSGTNDQTVIQAAIDDCPAGGGSLYLLEGTYNISGPINLRSGISLIGGGADVVLKISGGSGINVINAASADHILISQLSIDGNSNCGSGNNGINFDTVTYSSVEKVWILNMSGYGINASNSSFNIFSRNTIRHSKAGFYISSSSNNNCLSANEVDSSIEDGMHVYTSSNNIISGNIAWTNACGGIFVDDSSGNIIAENVAVSNRGNCYSRAGIDIWGPRNIVLGNSVQSNVSGGMGLYGDDYNIISGNSLQANGLDNIFCETSSSNVIFGNASFEPGRLGAWFKMNADNNIIASNRFYDSTYESWLQGIVLDGSNNNYLAGNLIDGAGYTGAGYDVRVYETGSLNTKYTDKTKLTLDTGSYTYNAGTKTLIPSVPTSYLQLSGPLDINQIAAGNAGDLLILENTTADPNTVVLHDGTYLRLQSIPITLHRYQTLTLIWDGSVWTQIGSAPNN